MKLASADGKRLWVAERRTTGVFTLGGKPGRPGVPRAKQFSTEAKAQQWLEAERDKRLAEGFLVVDEAATLDTPFTVDGRPKAFTLTGQHERLAAQVRLLVRGGFFDAEQIERVIELRVAELGHEGRQSRRREQPSNLSMDQRVMMERIDAEVGEEPRGHSRLGEALSEVARDERRALNAREPPDPWVNARLDAAFADLNERGIIALQGDPHQVTQRREDRARRGLSVLGMCFYEEDDVEAAVAGKGLWLGFGTFDALADEVSKTLAQTILDVLRLHTVPAEWSGKLNDRIRVLPFEWYRRPL